MAEAAGQTYLYDAFVSYSHAADNELAPVLQTHLQRFAKPWYRLRSLRIFRDDTTLKSTPHLWPDIRDALDAARYFVLLAAPQAAQSRWVQQEVSHWISTRGSETLLIVLTEGKIDWDDEANDFDWSVTNALPEVLRGAFKSEPKWEDVAALINPGDLTMQNPVLRKTVASLYAAISGRPLDEVIGEDVRQYRRTRLVAGGAIATFAVMSAAGGWYVVRTHEERELAAQRQRQIYEERVRSESRYVAERARYYTERGDSGVAMNLVLEDIEPDDDETPGTKPRIEESHLALFAGLHSHHEQNILRVGNEARNVGIAPNGDVLAISGSSVLVFDPKATTAKLRLPHPLRVTSAAFSRDGARILTASIDGKARLWTLADRKAVELPHGKDVVTARFDGQERRIATASLDGSAAVWDAASGQRLLVLAHDAEVNDVTWSEDGARVYTVAQNGLFRAWNAASGAEIFRKPGTSAGQRLLSVRVNPAGTRAVTAGRAGPATLWDTRDGSIVATLAHGRSNVYAAVFSPTDNLVVTTGSDLRAAVWDGEKGTSIYALLNHTNVVLGATFSKDGSRLMTWSSDRSARVYSACDGRELATLQGHTEDVANAVFTPDGCGVVTGGGDSTARIWSLVDRPGQRVLTEQRCTPAIPRQRGERCRSQQAFADQRRELLSASFSPDGKLVATAGNDRVARVFDVQTGERLAALPAQAQPITSVAFDKSGTMLVVGQGDIGVPERPGMVRVWSWREQREIVPAIAHTGSVQSVALSPDGTRILTASGDGLAQIFNAATGELILKIETPPDPQCNNKRCRLGDASWSPDGKRVATASYGYDACVWEIDGKTGIMTAEAKPQCVQHTYIVYSARWNSDGSLLLTASGDQTAVIWHARSGDAVRRFYGDAYDFRSAEFFDGDKQIVTANNDYAIRFWRSETGREMARVQHRQAHINSASIDSTGHLLLTSSADGAARIWQLPATLEDLAAAARDTLKRCLSPRQREEFNRVSRELPDWCAGKLYGPAAPSRPPATQAAVSTGQ